MVFKKPKIAIEDVMIYIKKRKLVTYLQLVEEFCPDNNNKELWDFVAHKIRQKIYFQIKRGTIKRVSRGKYKYNHK